MISRLIVVSVFAVHAAAAQGGTQTRADSAALFFRDSVVVPAEKRFFVAWDSLWKRSEANRHTFAYIGDVLTDGGPRRLSHHCHPDNAIPTRGGVSQVIQSKNSTYSVCPSFDLGEVTTTIEERTRLDDALIDSLIPVARGLRASLIALLDSAAVLLPADDFVVGQRVRFLVDQWEHEKALRVARECRATAWWCAALTGYASAARGKVLDADSACTAAVDAMPSREKCRWTDHRLVISFESRAKYSAVACDKRAPLNERIWWLADPLYIEPGNERKVEQDVRTVLLMLRTAIGRDERYNWGAERDDDAHQVMIVRYGWQSYAFWGGPFEDAAHTSYLGQRGTNPNPPYTTFEYMGSRAHVIPAWDAIADPFRAVPGDWTLVAPDAREPVAPRVASRAASRPAIGGTASATPARRPANWWPIEHFQPTRGLAQLYGGQQALLRRENGALVAVATQLDGIRLRRRERDTIPALTLVSSEAPGSVRRLATARGVVGQPFAMYALIDATPSVIGLEYPGGGGRGGPPGRLRFGVTPPPPLSALQPGQAAISDPVILRAPPADEILPSEVEAALRQMAVSHVVNYAGRMGVYWETYGLQPHDSVEVAVWIERYSGQSIIRRFGVVLGVTTDINTPVAVSWREPQPGHRSHVFREGNVPVVGRSVTIDVSQIPPGEYRLEVAVRKTGQEPLRGRTTFFVQ